LLDDSHAAVHSCPSSASRVHLILQLYCATHQYNTICGLTDASADLQDADVAPMEDDAAAAAADGAGEAADAGSAPGPSQLPEVELYSYLLVLLHLLDRKHFTQVRPDGFCRKGALCLLCPAVRTGAPLWVREGGALYVLCTAVSWRPVGAAAVLLAMLVLALVS
jgi:hypothetical protein